MSEQTKACPTCGSDDPRLCGWLWSSREGEERHTWGGPAECCPDPFHTQGTTEAEEFLSDDPFDPDEPF